MHQARDIRTWFRDLFVRHEPTVALKYNVKAGLGALVAILVLGYLLARTGLPLLIAPLGASTILLFGRPSGVLAQPVNVVAGYGIAVVIAFVSAELLPGVLWATAVSIGLTLVLMRLLRITHPPAGAIPLIAFANPSRALDIFLAVILGSLILVLIALLWHHLPPRQSYPRPVQRDPETGRFRLASEDD